MIDLCREDETLKAEKDERVYMLLPKEKKRQSEKERERREKCSHDITCNSSGHLTKRQSVINTSPYVTLIFTYSAWKTLKTWEKWLKSKKLGKMQRKRSLLVNELTCNFAFG